MLASYAKKSGLELLNDCQKHWVELDGQGRLSAYNFDNGVQMLLLDGSLSEDWEMETKNGVESPFLLYFCVRGRVAIDYDGMEAPSNIQPMTTLMAAHPPLQRQCISFKQGVKTTFVWISLERELYINHIKCLPEAVQEAVSKIFIGKTVIKPFADNEFGLKGAAILQQVLADQHSGLIHTTLAESKAIELFSLQLRRWESEIVSKPARKDVLRTEDYEKIVNARNMLMADVRNAPTIEVLSRKSGVNRQKLKQGFKQVFGATINDYLRNERLRIAHQMLSSGAASVKEVASGVGYDNPSYFARRFKEKYGVYPNEFVRTMQLHVKEEEE